MIGWWQTEWPECLFAASWPYCVSIDKCTCVKEKKKKIVVVVARLAFLVTLPVQTSPCCYSWLRAHSGKVCPCRVPPAQSGQADLALGCSHLTEGPVGLLQPAWNPLAGKLCLMVFLTRNRASAIKFKSLHHTLKNKTFWIVYLRFFFFYSA